MLKKSQMKVMRYLVLYFLSFPLHAGVSSASAQKPEMDLPVIVSPEFKKDTFSIVNYGAIPDGVTLNTNSVNSAIAACAKNGGGVVLVPAGIWISGPIELKSNVDLHLQKNALLQFTKDFSQYALVKGNWEGVHQMRNQSPIFANDQQNIAITGFGIIDSGGEAWRMVKKDKLTERQWRNLVASGGQLSEDQKTWYPARNLLKVRSLKPPE